MKKNLKRVLVAVLILGFAASHQVSAQQAYNIYFGNIHAHTSYSDGSKDSLVSNKKTPKEAYKYAKDSEHFDFFGISEHNHSKAGFKNKSNYARGIKQANNANQNGKFVALYGMEYGVITNAGHVLIYGFDKLIGWEEGNYEIFNAKFDYSSLFKLIAEKPGTFATLAHPDSNHFGNLKKKPYSLVADQAISGVAIATGQFDSEKTDYSVKRPLAFLPYYKMMLGKGYIVGPTMDHDNHYTTFGRHTASRTAVLAKSLTREEIINAYRANRFYATQDWNARVEFTINTETMGGYIKGSSDLDIYVKISDDDPSDKVKKIELYYGMPGKEQAPKKLASSKTEILKSHFSVQPGEAYYFYLDITQMDGDRIVTSPIWAKN